MKVYLPFPAGSKISFKKEIIDRIFDRNSLEHLLKNTREELDQFYEKLEQPEFSFLDYTLYLFRNDIKDSSA